MRVGSPRLGAHDFGEAEAARSLMPASLKSPRPAAPRASRLQAATTTRSPWRRARIALRQRSRIGDLGKSSAQSTLNDVSSIIFGDEDGPCHERGKGKTDHHGLGL